MLPFNFPINKPRLSSWSKQFFKKILAMRSRYGKQKKHRKKEQLCLRMVQLWQVWSRKMLGHICTSEICPSFFNVQLTLPQRKKAPGRIVCGSTS